MKSKLNGQKGANTKNNQLVKLNKICDYEKRERMVRANRELAAMT